MLGTEDTEVSDFIGAYTTRGGGGYGWTDGALVEAMERGCGLFVDEIGVIAPKMLTTLFSVMDGRDEIRITANPDRGIVKAQPGFFVLAATNPHAPGVRLSRGAAVPLRRVASRSPATTPWPANSACPTRWSPRRRTLTSAARPASCSGHRRCANCSAPSARWPSAARCSRCKNLDQLGTGGQPRGRGQGAGQRDRQEDHHRAGALAGRLPRPRKGPGRTCSWTSARCPSRPAQLPAGQGQGGTDVYAGRQRRWAGADSRSGRMHRLGNDWLVV